MPPKKRNIGLDLLRAAAIVSVVVYHSALPFAPLEQWGFLGVEAFFALSGFLILQMIAERFDGIRSIAALKAFLINRWLRTLPLYYLFLAVNVAISSTYATLNPRDVKVIGTFARVPDLVPFLFFTQNLSDGGGAAGWFGASWTLGVEEWFYLGLPLIVFAFRKQALTRTIAIAAGMIIVASLAARLHPNV